MLADSFCRGQRGQVYGCVTVELKPLYTWPNGLREGIGCFVSLMALKPGLLLITAV